MRRVHPALAIPIAMALAVAACGGGASTAAPSPTTAPGSSSAGRPSSPAVVRIVQPADGATLTGATVHVVVSLEGAEIVSAGTTTLSPTEGHLHLYVDNVLVSMNYGLEQDVPVHPGSFVLKAEFVAADHAPFNPRVWSPQVHFTVE